jgi:hypothetical protein
MIETSTPTTNSLQSNRTQNTLSTEDLGEEEQSFYLSIRKNLDAMSIAPGKGIIAEILDYSRSI